MFDFVTKNKRLIQIILAIIFLPFAFFGMDSYFRFTDAGVVVARVGDYGVSQQEFGQALRERQDALRRVTGGQIDSAVMDSPELRYATLEGLIQRRLLLERALRSGMTVSDAQLHSAIGEEPLFRDESNQFSFTRYEQFLRAQSMSPAVFEARLRQDLILRHLGEGYAGSVFVPKSVTERLAKLSEQQREVSHYTITPEKFQGQVALEAEAAKKYYDANQGEFRIPDQVRAEYVTLSLETLLGQMQLDPAEVRRFYESQRGQFEVKEARQASHILIGVEPAAGAEAKQRARARAEEIHKQLVQKPASFAELARQHSQDPGSAAKGGDLGFISRGAMKDVPEFEEALFKLKPGEVSPPVESRHGFHIIRLTALQPAQVKGLEEVRGPIEKELRKRLASTRFAELADQFNNVVYEQSESLKPAAELVKMAPQQSGWITPGRADNALLGNPKLLAAIFSDEVLKNRRNTEAIEVAPGTLVAARVIEHRPASTQPFAEMRAQIEKKLALREAGRLTVQEGRNQLEQLRQGKSVPAAWSAPQVVSRAEHKGVAEPIVRQAFRTDVAKLPAYAGVENPQGGYTVLRITRVQEADEVPAEKRQAFAEALRQVLGQEELTAYVASLKQKADVRISKEQLDKKER